MMLKGQKTLALSILLMLVGGILSPLRFAVNKVAVEDGMPPIAFAFWPILFSGLILLIISFLRGSRIGLRTSDLGAYFVIGGLILACPMALLTFLADKLPQGLISLVVGFAPILTYFFAVLFRIDNVKAISVCGFVIGIAGIVIIVVPDASLPASSMIWWLLLAIVAPVSLGLGNVLTSIMRRSSMPLTVLAAGMMLAASIILLVIMITSGQLYYFNDASLNAIQYIFHATLLCAVFYLLFLEIVRLSGPVFFSQMNYLSVAAGFGWGMLLFDETYSFYIWGGAALMAISVAIITIGAKAKHRIL